MRHDDDDPSPFHWVERSTQTAIPGLFKSEQATLKPLGMKRPRRNKKKAAQVGQEGARVWEMKSAATPHRRIVLGLVIESYVTHLPGGKTITFKHQARDRDNRYIGHYDTLEEARAHCEAAELTKMRKLVYQAILKHA